MRTPTKLRPYACSYFLRKVSVGNSWFLTLGVLKMQWPIQLHLIWLFDDSVV